MNSSMWSSEEENQISYIIITFVYYNKMHRRISVIEIVYWEWEKFDHYGDGDILVCLFYKRGLDFTTFSYLLNWLDQDLLLIVWLRVFLIYFFEYLGITLPDFYILFLNLDFPF